MAQQTILIVEDDDNILELITFHLKQNGFAVDQTFTGEEALERAFVSQPDLILLDLMLPGMSGLEVCATLKNDMATRAIPIVIVSARGTDTDVIAGLEAGADDYLVKPFLPPALVDMVQSMLRRRACTDSEPDQDLVQADIKISPSTQEVWLGDFPISLSDSTFQVLHDLARHAGSIRTRGQIKAAQGLYGQAAEDFSVDDQITTLCQVLGDRGTCIETVRRIGYRFKDQQV